MTVKELIEQLQAFPADADIFHVSHEYESGWGYTGYVFKKNIEIVFKETANEVWLEDDE